MRTVHVGFFLFFVVILKVRTFLTLTSSGYLRCLVPKARFIHIAVSPLNFTVAMPAFADEIFPLPGPRHVHKPDLRASLLLTQVTDLPFGHGRLVRCFLATLKLGSMPRYSVKFGMFDRPGTRKETHSSVYG